MSAFKSIVALVLLSVSVPSWGATAAGQVQLVKGEVFILDSQSRVVADVAGKRDRKIAPGAPFYVGETIVTKAGGRVKLQFVEGSNEIVLGADTSLLIQRASVASGKAGTTLDLARGEVRANVNRKYSGQSGETFEVKTKNAVAGVRGTVFVTRFDAKLGKSEIATIKGAVEVRNALGGANMAAVMVKPGQFTESGPQTKTLAVKPLASNLELKDAVQRLDDSSPNAVHDGPQGDDPKAAPADGSPKASADKGSPKASDDKGSQPAAAVVKNDAKSDKDAPPPAPLGREPVKQDSKSAGEGGRMPSSVAGMPSKPGEAPAAGSARGLMRGDMGMDAKPAMPPVNMPGMPAKLDQVMRGSQDAQRAQQQAQQAAQQAAAKQGSDALVKIRFP